ncbi:tetratricopeptide repeat protein [Elongatibacter sediminis]|uniref:Tetratricopeptide repeat protein n=1 Tax=Elongatibacter sediminis TaxID=3119006 RepID=A0AAW9REW1_9GAMM
MRSVRPICSVLALFLVIQASTALAVDPRDKRFAHTVYLQPYSKLRQAAELGDAEAQYDLAYLYYKADSDPSISGVVQSDKLAAQWYRKAAQQGHSRAQYNMAVLHLHGHGVDRDPVEAYAWLLLARERGHSGSEALLAELDGILNEKQVATARDRSGKLGVSSPPP